MASSMQTTAAAGGGGVSVGVLISWWLNGHPAPLPAEVTLVLAYYAGLVAHGVVTIFNRMLPPRPAAAQSGEQK